MVVFYKKYRNIIRYAYNQDIVAKKPRDRILLYKGREPTSTEKEFKNMSRNPIIAVDETGSIGPLESNNTSERKFFTVVGA